MDPETKQLIIDRYQALPNSIKSLVSDVKVSSLLVDQAKSFSLNPEQEASLSNEVFMTLLFFEPLSTLTGRIATEAGLPQVTAEKIAAELVEKIFSSQIDLFNQYSESYQPTENTPTPLDQAAAPRPTETETDTVPKIRTMAADMESQTHEETTLPGTSQDDLLNRN